MQIDERTFTIGAIRDITERTERAERERTRDQALRRDAQLDRIVFEEAPIGSVITGRDGRIERVNLAICTMLGHLPETFSGAHFLEFTHPEDREASAAAVAAVIGGAPGAQHFETRYLHASGRVIEARIALTAIRDDAEKVAQLFAQVEDVTDARRTTRELQQAQFEMLARLAAAAELHDDDTGQHTLRVADLSVAIARTIGLPDEQLELLRLAAPLHDVGKIAISDTVLRKRGKLTIEEFDQVKTHTTKGSQMLADSPFELLALAEQIALTHHEHWDGSGYPTGLAGEAIPITGRIVAVADVFDALTHSRPYKTGVDHGRRGHRGDQPGGHPLRPAGRRRVPQRTPGPLARRPGVHVCGACGTDVCARGRTAVTTNWVEARSGIDRGPVDLLARRPDGRAGGCASVVHSSRRRVLMDSLYLARGPSAEGFGSRFHGSVGAAARRWTAPRVDLACGRADRS